MNCGYKLKANNAKSCIYKRNRITAILKQTEQDLIHEKLVLNKISQDIQKKDSSVLKLEFTNITSLFYTLLKNKEEQLNEDRHTILKEKLKLEQCKNNIDYLVDETKDLVNKLDFLRYECENYEKESSDYFKRSNFQDNESKDEVLKLIKREEGIYQVLQQIDEAIIIGEKALEVVEKTILNLEMVEVWGDWSKKSIDYNDSVENLIDDALKFAEQTQIFLGDFRREICRIDAIINSTIPINTFENFSDNFFDALIFDWVVQSEICKTLDIAKNTKNLIDRVMSKLYEEKVTDTFLLNQIQEKIDIMLRK